MNPKSCLGRMSEHTCCRQAEEARRQAELARLQKQREEEAAQQAELAARAAERAALRQQMQTFAVRVTAWVELEAAPQVKWVCLHMLLCSAAAGEAEV